MARSAKAIVRGDAQILRNMTRAKEAFGTRELDEILIDGLNPMKETMEENARALRQPTNPKGGHLDQGIVVAKQKAPGRDKREFWLTFRRRARKIAHLVEFGTAPHWQPLRGRMHPGARPKPFARPAFEEEKNAVGTKIGRSVWDKIRRSISATGGGR